MRRAVAWPQQSFCRSVIRMTERHDRYLYAAVGIGMCLGAFLMAPLRAAGRTIFDFDEKAAVSASQPTTCADGAATAPVQPIPSAAARQQSQKMIEEMFGKELADRHSAARRMLTQHLLDEATKTADVPTDQFVLLIGARQAAEETPDLGLCFKAIDMLSGRFGMDSRKMKIESALRMPVASDSVAATVDNCRTAESLLEQLLADYDLDNAVRLAALLTSPSQADPALGALVRKLAKKAEIFRTEHDKVAKELEKLRGVPDDPSANLAVGQYLCFYTGAWTRGLPMLAKGFDPKLKALAASDLAAQNGGEKVLEIGDQWWEMADSQTEIPQSMMRQHAAALYQSGIDRATGLRREILAKRIADASLAGGCGNAGTTTAKVVVLDAGDAPAARAAVKAFLKALLANELPKARAMAIEAGGDNGVLELIAHDVLVLDAYLDALTQHFGVQAGPNWLRSAVDSVEEARVTFSKDRQLAMVDNFKGHMEIQALLVRRIGGKWMVDISDWNARSAISCHPAYTAARTAAYKQLTADIASGKVSGYFNIPQMERRIGDDLAKQFGNESTQSFHELGVHSEAWFYGRWAVRVYPRNIDPARASGADIIEGTLMVDAHGSSMGGPAKIADHFSKTNLLLGHLDGSGARLAMSSGTSGRNWTFEPQPALDRIIGTATLNDGIEWVAEGIRMGR